MILEMLKMRTPLWILLIALILNAYTNGLPYNQIPEYYTSQQSSWYNNKQDQQQDNSFSNVSPHILQEQQVGEFGTGWNQLNPSLYISQSDLYSGSISQNTDVSDFITLSQTNLKQEEITDGGLTLSCKGDNKICVNKDLCIDGYVNFIQKELIRDKQQIQQCNLKYEICCILKDYFEQSSSDVGDTSIPFLEHSDYLDVNPIINNQEHIRPEQVDQQNLLIDLSPSQNVESTIKNGVKQVVIQQQITDFNKDTDISSSTAVPLQSSISSSTNLDHVFTQGSAEVQPSSNLPNSRFTDFQVPLQLGCAAALLCVEEQFCTKEGVISTQPITFTEKDILQRVPLSSCKNSENGIIGKCCRDPNYVDPWPTGNLPANYSGGFDEQGFPTFLNIAKVRPPKKPTSATKTASTIKPSVKPTTSSNEQIFTTKSSIPTLSTLSNENNYEVPDSSIHITKQDTGPFYTPQNPLISNETPFIEPRPFTSNIYNTASSKQNSVLVPSGQIQNKCGVRNNVLHTEELDKPVTSFGEIPWQAMILSNKHRSILCSGVIITPNIVLTTAYCVNGITPQEVSVKSGEWKLGYELEYEEPLPFEITNVSSIVIHPNYVLGSSLNDIAVLYLENAITYNRHVNPLCLSNSIETQTLNKCIVTGWGQAIIKVHALGAIMNSLDLDILSPDVCMQHASGQKYNINIEYGSICAKSHNINHNMCQTEIGGPLACQRENGIYELAGLYSQDNGCSPTHQIAIFTPIDNDWLKKMIYYNEKNISSSTFNTKDDLYDYRKSDLPSKINQYLPPI
ncbi:uncharacterized protein LOC118440384 isoform X1 [Vespa mandarinia]|uniref:uncharacterized protein LOC118440384 isoform X1 n=2 Tax=Vespa mandarinia TaxID=7446 RepID=UPI00161A4CC9|nr:uncharacterized protein LOC118440384 isoform X1 [Vespa mandarinia]